MAPRPKARQTVKAEKPESNLLNALKFLACVTEKEGAIHETHVLLRNSCAVAFNGILSAGIPISEDILCYPHNEFFIEALSKCDENFSLTQMDLNRLSIKSGKFKAIIPCIDPALAQFTNPDEIIAPINDKFKTAVEAVGVLASENAQHVLTASVLMNGQSVIATNRKMIFEYWHGLDLPPNVPLPKQFTAALAKNKKELSGFGFSNSSATFWFADGSWLKTQLYNDHWPDVSRILNREANLWPIDPNFFKALEAVMPFSEDGNVYFDTNIIRSHEFEGKGASHEVAGIPKGPVYPAKQLLMLKPHVKKIDFIAPGPHPNSYQLTFHGDNIRGMVMGREK